MKHTELIERLRTDSAYNNITLGNEAADAIESLQAENASITNDALKFVAERDALKLDAERYRHIRSPFLSTRKHKHICACIQELDDVELDEAIDAAMKGAA